MQRQDARPYSRREDKPGIWHPGKRNGTATPKRKTIKQKLKERDREYERKEKGAKRRRVRAKTVRDYIGYNRMFRDGICEVEEAAYSQTLSFPDISYQSAREDRQKVVFNAMRELLDYFGPDTLIQFNVINTPILKEDIGKREFFPSDQKTDAAKQDAALFNQILNKKMLEGISNIQRRRYITYTVNAPSPWEALPSLSRIRNDVIAQFSKLGCEARPLTGSERLKLIQDQIRPGHVFSFDYERDLSPVGLTDTKDFISPLALDFMRNGDASRFYNGEVFGQVLIMRRLGSELSDRVISDIADLPIPLNVTWFLQSLDKTKAINEVKLRSGWIDKEIIEKQQQAAQRGYDVSILPSELTYSKEESLDLLKHLQGKDQRLYFWTGLIYTYASDEDELDERVIEIISVARKNSVEVETLDYRQREGLNSVLPLGSNHVGITRPLTTTQAAIMMPFATQELDQEGGTYCGQNKSSNNLVICNRKSLASPVGFISGKTGAGKSFFVKQECEGTILNNPDDQIIIFDRAGEYRLMAKHHLGTEMRFGIGSYVFMNPFDISMLAGKPREYQIAFKVDAMLAQAAASASEAGKTLDEGEQSIITRAVEQAFSEADMRRKGEVPLLGDFYRALKGQPEPQAEAIALRYERFVSGSMSFFNHKSTVDWSGHVIDINIKELPDSMLVFALITMCEAVRNQMYRNFEKGRRTWIYIEEIQSLFRYPTVLNYFSRFANESRKFGGLITGITQNSIAMLENEAARSIVLNADFIMLLKQSPLDRRAWADLLGLSAQEEGAVDETCATGCGLLVAGPARIPIVGGFPKDNCLYELFSTDPNEVASDAESARLRKRRRGHRAAGAENAD